MLPQHLEAYDIEFSSVMKNFKASSPNNQISNRISDGMESGINLVNAFLLYISMEKPRDTIQKIRRIQRGGKSKKNEKTYPTPLFNNVLYSYDGESSSNRTVSSHIRRGHFRKQPYGATESKKYKTIWIKPMVIGEDKAIKQKIYKA